MNYVEKVAYYALKAFEGQEEGSARKADSNRVKMRKAVMKLYENGEISNLKPLMYHEHDAVKCEIAIELLPFYTEEAEKVLEELSCKRGNLTYSTAKLTLQEWRKGNIKFTQYQK